MNVKRYERVHTCAHARVDVGVLQFVLGIVHHVSVLNPGVDHGRKLFPINET